MTIATPLLAAGDSPVTIDRFGIWSLRKLGYGELSLQGNLRGPPPVIFNLPSGATQGPSGWYLIHLQGEIEFSSGTGSGAAYVTASTNGRAGAQIKFEISSETPSSVKWSSVDLVNGRVETVALRPFVQFSMSNYLQSAGIQPGLNTLAFDLETSGGVEVEELTILSGSGVEYTPMAPPHLELTLELFDGRIGLGDQFSIKYLLANTGGRPVRNVDVDIAYPSASFELLGADVQQHAEIDRSARGEFSLKAKREGVFRVFLDVTSGSNRPFAEVSVTVDSSPLETGSRGPSQVLWISAGVLFVVTASLAVLRHFVANRRARD